MLPHPRLYASRLHLERLRLSPAHPALSEAAQKVRRDAAEYVLGEVFNYDEAVHNAHLIRARTMQRRIVTLLVERFRTGQPRFRDAVMRHIGAMDRWTHWSWIAARQGKDHPNDIFDLSYGENSATLAMAYDWLYFALSKEERARCVHIARRRALIPFLKNTQKQKPSWWFGKPDTNWNTVCAGGAGMLALSMYEDAPEAREVLRRAEASIVPFMRYLKTSGGGWPEGIGYWNYGMRYAFMYLLSHEHATGRVHPLMKLAETKATLYFPLDFCPGGVPCSFGDVNRWSPLPFHYAAAERLNCKDLLPLLDEALTNADSMSDVWPDAAELLVFHPRNTAGRASLPAKLVGRASLPAGGGNRRHEAPPSLTGKGAGGLGAVRSLTGTGSQRQGLPVARLYRGLDWGILADRWPNPNLYVSLRGGTTKVPHSHRDLLSFHLMAGGEKMVHNIGIEEYLDSTFSARRFELFETLPASKNTILINGVGIAGDATVKTTLIKHGKLHGIRIDATEAMGKSRDGGAALFCGRLLLLLGAHAVLIVDRIETRFPARMETRFHTFVPARVRKESVELRGKRARMHAVFASDNPCQLCTAQDAPTTPGKGATMVRWCTQGRDITSVTFAALFARAPGKVPGLSITTGRKDLGICIISQGAPHIIPLSTRLEL